jgi:CheY-like chemotaxis protein
VGEKRVLLVEDQNAFLLQALPELYGRFEFDVANDGCAAVEKLKTGPRLDLVLLDLRLPGLDGLAVLDAIRNVDACLPVIAVSAYGDKRTRQEAARREANDFFHKPFSFERQHRRMRELMAIAPGRNGADTLALSGREAETLARQRRLLKLKERRALLGIDAPPELLIEIEDLERKLEEGQP